MKFLTIFAVACVASFVVLHGVYGSPVPGPQPSPVADPAPKTEPAAKAEPMANPKTVASPNSLPSASPLPTAGGDASFVALSANAEPMVPASETAVLKNDEILAI